MDRRAFFASFAALAILWACNDHDPHPPSVTDPGTATPGGGGGGGGGGGSSGTTNDGGGTEGGSLFDAGSECTDLEDPSTIVDQNAIADNAPPGLGGTLVDGTYDLTTAQRYVGASGQAGPNGVTYREIIRITNGTRLDRNRSVQQNSGPLTTVNASYVIQVSGTTLILTQQCPAQAVAETFSFTFQNGQLTLTGATGESFTYRGRP